MKSNSSRARPKQLHKQGHRCGTSVNNLKQELMHCSCISFNNIIVESDLFTFSIALLSFLISSRAAMFVESFAFRAVPKPSTSTPLGMLTDTPIPRARELDITQTLNIRSRVSRGGDESVVFESIFFKDTVHPDEEGRRHAINILKQFSRGVKCTHSEKLADKIEIRVYEKESHTHVLHMR